MVSKKRQRFIVGSNGYRHKPISIKLIKKIKRLQKQIEKDNKLKAGSVSFVWVTDNIDVRLKK